MEISLRSATPDDYDFLWWLHCATIRPYVEKTWGWDEDWQIQHFQERFDPGTREIIESDRVAIGCISTERYEDRIFLALIEIAPDYQSQGIGTKLIRALLNEGNSRDMPVELRVLRVNPAQRLYERLGFGVVKETETHRTMRWVPESAA
jgi:ribosomal protein S18 acetylase RimI-like enzyme